MEAKGKINGKENDLEAEGEIHCEEINSLYIEKDNFEANCLCTATWISQKMIISYAKSCCRNWIDGEFESGYVDLVLSSGNNLIIRNMMREW